MKPNAKGRRAVAPDFAVFAVFPQNECEAGA